MIALATPEELPICLAIRREVFIQGQNVPEHEEVDGKDAICRHYLMREGGTPIGTARVLDLDGVAKIQRVAILESHRGTGAGARLMRYILGDLAVLGFAGAKLGSQIHAIGFYEKLGFVAHGPEYDDAGIAHRDMLKDLTPPSSV